MNVLLRRENVHHRLKHSFFTLPRISNKKVILFVKNHVAETAGRLKLNIFFSVIPACRESFRLFGLARKILDKLE